MVGVTNDMVGRENAEDGVRIDPAQNMGGQADGRCGVALRGLGDDLRSRDLGQLANDLIPDKAIGQNPEAFGRNQGPKAIHRLLDQGSFVEPDRQDLFRMTLAALRPKTGTATTGQNQAVVVVIAQGKVSLTAQDKNG